MMLIVKRGESAKPLRVYLIDKLTRSQTVARIADRTAKNCKGHVT